MMEELLDLRVKVVLDKHPELANLLKEYDITCYKCRGNCLFKDIIEEHSMSMKTEIELMGRMQKLLS